MVRNRLRFSERAQLFLIKIQKKKKCNREHKNISTVLIAVVSSRQVSRNLDKNDLESAVLLLKNKSVSIKGARLCIFHTQSSTIK